MNLNILDKKFKNENTPICSSAVVLRIKSLLEINYANNELWNVKIPQSYSTLQYLQYLFELGKKPQ